MTYTYEELVEAAHLAREETLKKNSHESIMAMLGLGQLYATLAVANRLDRLGDLLDSVIYEGEGRTHGLRISR